MISALRFTGRSFSSATARRSPHALLFTCHTEPNAHLAILFNSQSSHTHQPVAQKHRPDENVSENASENVNLPPLPELPPPVQGWPTFWIHSKDAQEYLYPLYFRGWGVRFLPRKYYASHSDRYTAHLTTDFTLCNYNCASKFIKDLNSICETEKHHPSSFSLLNAAGQRPVLSLYVQTHTALRPRWNEEDPSADPPLSRRVPGITRRDLRFALLVERLYDSYHRSGKALEMRGRKVKAYWERPTWEHLLSRFIRNSLNDPIVKVEDEREQLYQLLAASGTSGAQHIDEERKETQEKPRRETEKEPIQCHACGGPHKIQDCSVRSQYPPPTLCYLCLEPHWWLDCPSRQNPTTP
ncbi:hypothetical protein D9756_011230 [Leucocoprinus leucothites]|uniref:4a-hydroxytetrahydrobiopterin dehydratase n=1 Tax=Leucocoprinus leucothites TaxID=201217 RepID=A0A8H5CMT2_9AGAR|nr:hypothetical protein D9756_011230 [Leucoagaricus leucothites]